MSTLIIIIAFCLLFIHVYFAVDNIHRMNKDRYNLDTKELVWLTINSVCIVLNIMNILAQFFI